MQILNVSLSLTFPMVNPLPPHVISTKRDPLPLTHDVPASPKVTTEACNADWLDSGPIRRLTEQVNLGV